MNALRRPGGRARKDLLGRNVLLVEDDFYHARDTQQALQHAGARVIGPFPDVAAALESVAAYSPSCAVIDIRLSDGLSFSVATALLARNIPFIFLTALDPSLIPAEFAHVQVFRKPVDYRALLSEASRICGARWR